MAVSRKKNYLLGRQHVKFEKNEVAIFLPKSRFQMFAFHFFRKSENFFNS